ncbi:MAG: adaptor protein MecA [Streptococcaceae bacterium]|jgi:adapter protein MecA 1/2|nr:adaptor protein MecA [Streptococcaceae bacterium]
MLEGEMMEMERVNENTIRLSIDQDDLNIRGINFFEMMLNQGEVENFFFTILDEIDEAENFANSDMVSFQVIPHAQGLEVYITNGTPNPISMQQIQERIQQLPEGAQGILDMSFEKKTAEEIELENVEMYPKDFRSVIYFADFEQLITLAKNIRLTSSNARLFSKDDAFYLLLENYGDEQVEIDFLEDTAKLYEYGAHSRVKPDILIEHGKQLIGFEALDVLKKNFKK